MRTTKEPTTTLVAQRILTCLHAPLPLCIPSFRLTAVLKSEETLRKEREQLAEKVGQYEETIQELQANFIEAKDDAMVREGH